MNRVEEVEKWMGCDPGIIFETTGALSVPAIFHTRIPFQID